MYVFANVIVMFPEASVVPRKVSTLLRPAVAVVSAVVDALLSKVPCNPVTSLIACV